MNFRIEKFTATSLPEAVKLAYAKLGPQTVLIHTKTYRKKGFLGLWGKDMFEVAASNDVAVLRRAAKPPEEERPRTQRIDRATERLRQTYQPATVEAAREKSAASGGDSQRLSPPVEAPKTERLALPDLKSQPPALAAARPADAAGKTQAFKGLQEEIGEIKSMLGEMMRKSDAGIMAGMPPELQDAYLFLVQNEVSEALARALVQRLNENLSGEALKNRDLIREKLRAYIAELIPVRAAIALPNDRPYVIALIGPTGVGKTTTLAKLAAHFRLREGRSVAMITQDTYRLAAVDQLRTYARILNLPLEVVNTPGQMTETLQRFGAKDVVLIDTAGRSQNNDLQLNELQLFLEAAKPDETHLVMSMTASEVNLMAVREKFAAFQPNSIILTKLDEMVSFGLTLNILSKVDAKLSYVTFGQEVPDDIEPGSAAKLTQLILGEASLGS